MKITSQLIDEVFDSEEWKMHADEWMYLRVDGGVDELKRLVGVLGTASLFVPASGIGFAMTAFQYGVEVGIKLGQMEYLERTIGD